MTHTRLSRFMTAAAVGGALMAGPVGQAFAEANEVRFAEQFGIAYLPLNVMIEQERIQVCGREEGLGDVNVTLHRFSGGAAVNQALLARQVDFAAGGVGPLLVIWDRTRGSHNVKAAANIANTRMKLITNDPEVKTIEDLVGRDDHKIGLPSVKVSIQARTLQMAAAEKWGMESFEKLDDNTVSMNHPSAATAVLAGGQAVKSHFGALPFTWQLEQAGHHVVLDSYEVLGGPHSFLALYNVQAFKDENPKLYGCVVRAVTESQEWIRENRREAAELFVRFTQSRLPVDDIYSMIQDDNEINFTSVPERTMRYAEFLHEADALRNKAESWKDYFFENNHDLSGS